MKNALRSRSLARSAVQRLAGLVLVLALAPLATGARAAQDFDHAHGLWSEVLASCVRDGGFDYEKLRQDRAKLDAYLASLQRVTPEELARWDEKQRFAFWINAYNAFCIQRVVDAYPLKSIRKLDGAFGIKTVFDKGFIPMQPHHPEQKAELLSLNDIEHGILRRRFKDARLHAAINCASVSCPPLLGEAFTAARLDEQLSERMRSFVNDPTRNRIDPERKELAVSEIFKWFAEDFERDAKSIQEYLVRYAPAERAEFIRASKLRYLDYDWSLNDVPAR